MTTKLWTTVFLAAGAIIVTIAADPASAKESKAKWVAQCESVLSKDNSPKAKRVYCTCMYEDVGDIEDKYEYVLEREFPPVHQGCYKKAGFKPPR